MTIALFTDSYLPTKSGVVTVVVQLREQLMKLGHKVVLVTVEGSEPSEKDPTIYRARSRALGRGTDQFVAVPNYHPITKFIRANNVDLIHCHTEFGIGKAGVHCAKKLNIPCICTTHTMWTDFYKFYLPLGEHISPRIIQKLLNNFYGKFDSLIGVSTKARNYFKQPFMLPDQPSVIVPNAIDESKFLQGHLTVEERREFRKKYGINDDDIMFLFLGRIAEEKRVFELLSIVKDDHQYH